MDELTAAVAAEFELLTPAQKAQLLLTVPALYTAVARLVRTRQVSRARRG